MVQLDISEGITLHQFFWFVFFAGMITGVGLFTLIYWIILYI